MSASPRLALSATLLAGLLAACSSSSSSTSSATTGTAGATSGTSSGAGGGAAPKEEPAVKEDLQGRDYDLKVPADLDESKPAPLLLALHGFTAANNDKTPWLSIDSYMHLGDETEKRGMILALPHGTLDKSLGSWSWNGTDACCGWDTMADDIGYLLAVVSDIESKYNVDKKRIFVLGHSNGGFMAHRLACDRSSRFAGIVSLAGEVYKDAADCVALDPIAVLQVQGDADKTVSYLGGPPMGLSGIPDAPGAVETAETWAAKNHCDGTPDTSAAAVDLVTNLDGAETQKSIYKGCQANGQTELWTIHGGPHSPSFNASWAPSVIDFLMAHPKE